MNLTTNTLAVMLCLLVGNQLFGAQITIIESRSMHPFHTMDLRWQTVAADMGHGVEIMEQEALTDLNNISHSDILIISSGLIDIPEAHYRTIRQFVEQGGNVYIQSEYLITNAGNHTFSKLVNELGGQFKWEGRTQGSLTPMKIPSGIFDEPTPIKTLDYFWYGTYGSGDKQLIPIMEFKDKDYGFIFCPTTPTYGKVITISDQDWVRAFNNPTLMGNLVHYLANSYALSNLPKVQIIADNDQPCDGTDVTFSALLNQNLPASSFEWSINGQPAGVLANTLTTNKLNNGDVVECRLIFDADCTAFDTRSNAISYVEIMPIPTPQVTIIAPVTDACRNDLLTFDVLIENATSATDLTYTWTINNQPAGYNKVFTTNTLNNGDIVGLQLSYDDVCTFDNIAQAQAVQIAITETAIPTISLVANTVSICEGEMISFEASGTNWGNNPLLQWYIDGQIVATNITQFSSNALRNGQKVSCGIISNARCASNDPILSTPITVEINSPLTPQVSIMSTEPVMCDGSQATFLASGLHLGNQPEYIWTVDGKETTTLEPVFTVNAIRKGMEVSVKAMSNAICLTRTDANSEVITIEPSQPVIQILEQVDDHCGLTNGLIEIEAMNGAQPFTYFWSHGERGNILTDLTAGIYEVTAIDINGCEATMSIEIKAISAPVIQLMDVQHTDCSNLNGMANALIEGQADNYLYSWRTADGQLVSRSAQVDELRAGTYLFEVADEFGCATKDSIVIENSGDIEFTPIFPSSIGMGETAEIQLERDNNTIIDFEWETNSSLDCINCADPIVRPLTTTHYQVTGTNEAGCELSKEFTITVIPNRDIFIPNAFSPNGDGHNDFFTLFAGTNVSRIKSMKIFDRWGATLFERNDFINNQEQEGWDGSFQGKTLKMGVYVYSIEVEFIDGHTENYSGDISIMK